MLKILVKPADRPGWFHAYLGDELLCTASSPFASGARELLDRGYPADTRLTGRHEGSPFDSFKPSTLKVWAGWEVPDDFI